MTALYSIRLMVGATSCQGKGVARPSAHSPWLDLTAACIIPSCASLP